MNVLGIDIGGTGIKGAIVDTSLGVLVSERLKIPTPSPATPKEVIKVTRELIKHFDWQGKPIGCGFPSIIKKNVSYSAVNIDDSWKGINLKQVFKEGTGNDILFMNDADAAGLAEIHFGAGKNANGTVLMLTLGTGIGSGLFRNGRLIPNSEFGSLRFRDNIAEYYASNIRRVRDGLSWEEWGSELSEVLQYFNQIISPNLMILGGGVSKYFKEFKPYLDVDTKIKKAKLLNHAGIIGVATRTLSKIPILD